MHFIKAVNARSGVKVMVLLLIISFCIMAFHSATSGTPGVTYGDVNEDGEINVRDVVLVMQYVLELRTLTDDQLKAADVNGDGVVDVKDATLIMQYALGLIDEFPTRVKVESVEEVELEVPYGTKLEMIEFPETVKATLDDNSEKEIEVEWEDTSDPEYNYRSANDYVFEGKLVNLPSGVGNPDEVKAKATVTVYLPWKTIPIPPVDPDLTEFTVTFEEQNNLEGVEIGIYEDEDYEEQVSDPIVTDQDGRASIDLEDGKYYFVAERSGYQDFPGEFEIDGFGLLIKFEMVPEVDEYDVTFVERRGVASSIELYKDEVQDENLIDVLDAEDGTAITSLVDNSYSFTASPTDELYADVGFDFTVDGEDKFVLFQFATSEYVFSVNSTSEYVYDRNNNQQGIDAAYYFYAVGQENINAADYVYAPDGWVEFSDDEVDDYGYDEVQFRFEVMEKPEDGEVYFRDLENGTVVAMTGDNDVFYSNVINVGSTFTARWLPLFKEEELGEYTIHFSLVCAKDDYEDTIIANIEKTVLFEVGDSPPNLESNFMSIPAHIMNGL